MISYELKFLKYEVISINEEFIKNLAAATAALFLTFSALPMVVQADEVDKEVAAVKQGYVSLYITVQNIKLPACQIPWLLQPLSWA